MPHRVDDQQMSALVAALRKKLRNGQHFVLLVWSPDTEEAFYRSTLPKHKATHALALAMRAMNGDTDHRPPVHHKTPLITK